MNWLEYYIQITQDSVNTAIEAHNGINSICCCFALFVTATYLFVCCFCSKVVLLISKE